jgi:hypothetical protein
MRKSSASIAEGEPHGRTDASAEVLAEADSMRELALLLNY